MRDRIRGNGKVCSVLLGLILVFHLSNDAPRIHLLAQFGILNPNLSWHKLQISQHLGFNNKVALSLHVIYAESEDAHVI